MVLGRDGAQGGCGLGAGWEEAAHVDEGTCFGFGFHGSSAVRFQCGSVLCGSVVAIPVLRFPFLYNTTIF